MTYYKYRDIVIERNLNGMFSAFIPGKGYLKADTLAGIKRLIKKDETDRIKVYAQHFHSPIANLKEFNRFLKMEGLGPVKKEEVARMLNYI